MGGRERPRWGENAGAFSPFLLLYNNKLTGRGFVVPGWGISTTHMLRP